MQNYFVVNGTRHYTGAVFIVNNMGQQSEATFLCYNPSTLKYSYRIKECTWHVNETEFRKNLVCVTDKVNDSVSTPTICTPKDSEINGMFIGWVWYIFCMLISTILNGQIVFWALESLIFFSWRAEKKKEGTHIEW